MYEAQVEALSENAGDSRGYRCIAYDHRGQGRSQTSPVPYDIETLTADAEALLARLGASPCHFVGLSMGGFVGLRLALRRPELLRSLTLIQSAADAEPRWNVPKYRAMVLFARLAGFGPLVPAVMRIMFGQTFLRDPNRGAIRQRMADALGALDVNRTEAALATVTGRAPVLAELSAIRTPTLVLHGTEDRAIVPARAEQTARAISGAKLVKIPRAGHTSSVEEPAAITRALRTFLDRH